MATNSSAKFSQHKAQVKLSGELNFESVADLLNNTQISFENGDVEVDLSEISRFNSASLALLVEWLKIAQKKGVQIKYHSVPEQLMVIAQAYGIDHELPLS
ncbi:MAG TPA: STAS domain-containing protein [Gammaproteobacteria bacterium]|nr:STAS domain-containing protein [Gammaproteobacteria bacterium]